MRCGRIQSGMTIWMKVKAARVAAMAGMVRRISTPVVTPRSEGERGVADRGDAAGGKLHEPERNEADTVFRSSGRRQCRSGWTTGQHQAEQPGGGHGAQSDDAELDGQPAGAGDALSPRQPEGAGLEFRG